MVQFVLLLSMLVRIRFYQELEKGDPKQTIRMAHTLKSVAAGIGATEVSHAAIELEKACKQNDQIKAKLALVDQSLKKVLEGLQVLTMDPAPVSEKRMTTTERNLLLTKLSTLLMARDTEAAQTLNQMRHQTDGTSKQLALFDQLDEQIQNYDYKTAIYTLEQLTNALEAEF